MATLPQSTSIKRSPRLQLAAAIPTVLRLANGRCDQAGLRTISMTGGLLHVPATLIHGVRVKMMFVTDAGTIMGAAEMLKPLSINAQPFRFTALDEISQRRLKGMIHPEVTAPESNSEEWILKYRKAMSRSEHPRPGLFGVILAAVTVLVVGAAIAFSMHIGYLQ